MTDAFEYDVFLSFSSADEEIAKPIWQELCSNGLRVFWSDASLKKEVGNSWFETIEKSLERSKHMLLICSENSMNSKWVKREYEAFYDQCYSLASRRLIPALTLAFKPKNLPLFLRGLQVVRLDNPQFIRDILPVLGGIDIRKLQRENNDLQKEVLVLTREIESLNKKISQIKASSEKQARENISKVKEQIEKENASLKRQLNNRKKTIANLEEEIKAADRRVSYFRETINSLTNELEAEIKKPKVETQKVDLELKFLFMAIQTEIHGHLSIDHKIVPDKTVYIINLPESTKGVDLENLFSMAGKVKTVHMDEARGFGIVEMSSAEETQTAVRMFHAKDYSGRLIIVGTIQSAEDAIS